MITANGSPKTGTHLLLKALYLFGGEGILSSHQHKPYRSVIDGKHIHITRHPKNTLISWLRFTGQELVEQVIIDNMQDIINEMTGYVGWLSDESVCNVTFEELLTNEQELVKISNHINIPLAYNHFKRLWGGTNTSTGSPSNWKTYWNDELQYEWINQGGLTLEKTLGYENYIEKVRYMDFIFVMLARVNLPVFDKGDIVTAIDGGSGDFGANIKNNGKFHIVKVTGVSLEEAESLVSPLVNYADNPDLEQTEKARALTVDVDFMLDYTEVTKEVFLSKITQKPRGAETQLNDVIV